MPSSLIYIKLILIYGVRTIYNFIKANGQPLWAARCLYRDHIMKKARSTSVSLTDEDRCTILYHFSGFLSSFLTVEESIRFFKAYVFHIIVHGIHQGITAEDIALKLISLSLSQRIQGLVHLGI